MIAASLLDNNGFVGITTALLALSGSYLLVRSATRRDRDTAKIAERGVDAEAFKSAKDFYTDTLDRQGKEIADLRRLVVQLQEQVAEQQKQLNARRGMEDELRTKITELETQLQSALTKIGDLEGQLRRAEEAKADLQKEADSS